MITRKAVSMVVCGFLTAVALGCSNSSPAFWTPLKTEELQIDTAGVLRMEAQTHNGTIDYTGRAERKAGAKVIVTMKGGGNTMEEAQAALNAIDLRVTTPTESVKRIDWGWAVPRQPAWAALVSFRIEAPKAVGAQVTTHNGEIRLSGVSEETHVQSHNGRIDVFAVEGDTTIVSHNGAVRVGGCRGSLRIESHNGSVETESSGGSLGIEGYNGRVVANYEGSQAVVKTHNGGINADFSRCKSLGGHLETDNGAITLTVADGFSAKVTCSTSNGSISCNAPGRFERLSNRELTARFGAGDAKLDISTRNGSIDIRQ